MCLIHFYKRDKDTSKLCQGCLLLATLGLDIHNLQAINLHIQIILNSLRTVIILSSLLMATILKCLSSMHQERLPRIHHKLEQLEVLPPTRHNCLVLGHPLHTLHSPDHLHITTVHHLIPRKFPPLSDPHPRIPLNYPSVSNKTPEPSTQTQKVMTTQNPTKPNFASKWSWSLSSVWPTRTICISWLREDT